jgi:hypothetical protein
LAFAAVDSDEARKSATVAIPGTLGHMLKKANRTFKHIWFLPTRKAQTKNQKSLNFCQRSTEK